MPLTTNIIASAMHGKGRMYNVDIYLAVMSLTKKYGIKRSPHWKATVRNTMQRHCKGNDKYIKPNLFIHHGRGVWECRR